MIYQVRKNKCILNKSRQTRIVDKNRNFNINAIIKTVVTIISTKHYDTYIS